MKFIGHSSMAVAIRKTIERVARTSSTVLITGESGTGKELVAGAIHATSKRCSGYFEAVNCAGIPENLIENELFGHNTGAYTGATRMFKGAFERANEGTIFLDEIGDMPLSVQAKVLRTIENRKIRRLGGSLEIPINVRVIAATNKNLIKEMQEKRFREDLYFRLAVVTMHLPPLRMHTEDIPDLVDHLLPLLKHDLNIECFPTINFSIKELQMQAWPGNVRELRNFLERTLVLYSDPEILEPESFSPLSKQTIPT